MENIKSRPYNVDPNKACEKCVFGTGQHEHWCPYSVWVREFNIIDDYLDNNVNR